MDDHNHINDDELVALGRASVETKGNMGPLADSDQTPRLQAGISDE